MITDNIKRILQEKNITQKDLADKLRLSHQYVKQLLQRDSITEKSLKDISDALNVPAWLLLMDDESITNYINNGTPFANVQEQQQNEQQAYICPNCGKPIKLHIELE